MLGFSLCVIVLRGRRVEKHARVCTALHSRIKSSLIMMSNPISVLLNSVYLYCIEDFCIVMRNIGL